MPESFAFWFCSFSKKYLQRFVGDDSRPGKLIPTAPFMEALAYKPLFDSRLVSQGHATVKTEQSSLL